MHWSQRPAVELSDDLPGGPDFFKLADAPEKPKKGGKAAQAAYREAMSDVQRELYDLYRRACYDPNFILPVAVKRTSAAAPCIPGQIWGGQPGTGPTRARVMVVSKWPALTEVNAGRLMCSPSGELLEELLREAGFSPADYLSWYVTNVCHHPNVDPSSDRLTASWSKNWAPVLAHEFSVVAPDFVLCLGREAADAVLGEDSGPMKELFGRQFERETTVIDFATGERRSHPYQVVAVVNPSSVLHDPVNRDYLNSGLRYFYNLVRTGEAPEQTGKRDWRVVYYAEELAAIVDESIARSGPSPIIFVDAEWHGEYPGQAHSYLRTVQFSDKAGFACCVVLRHAGGRPAFCPSIDSAVPILRKLLISTPERKVRVAGHHLRADLVRIHAELDPVLGNAMIEQFAPGKTPEACRFEGGFDTMVAAHAVRETGYFDGFKLEYVCQALLGVPRWNVKLEEWLHGKKYDGYGDVPDAILHEYGMADVAHPRELVDRFLEPGGLLDEDENGNPCWRAFWSAQRAAQAFLEMEMTGVYVDKAGAVAMCGVFQEAAADLYKVLRGGLNWPGFNVNSPYDVREMLYGEQYRGTKDGQSGRPEDALSLYIQPVKTSGKPSVAWSRVAAKRQEHLYTPSTDKEVLGILLSAHPLVGKLRDLKFVLQMLKMALRPPAVDSETSEILLDDDGEPLFDSGLISCIQDDSRIYTHFFPTAETGRSKSVRPNLSNLSKRRDKDYKRILGKQYARPLRALIMATPPETPEEELDPWILVDFDLRGAELFVTAIQSGDATMIDHCSRANLDEDDPNYHDIHSSVAVQAFGLVVPSSDVRFLPVDSSGQPDTNAKNYGRPVCEILNRKPGDPLPASKKALELIGKVALRIAAKTVVFGLLYGRGDEAVVRAVLEEGVSVTIEDAARLRATIFQTYPGLAAYFEACKGRVTKERHMASCFERRRRFPLTADREAASKLERESSNFPIQSSVADIVNDWMYELYNYPGRVEDGEKVYRFLLQLHDALLCECRASKLSWFCKEVIPTTLDNIEVWPCDLDGKRLAGARPYKMGVEIEVQSRWGVKLSREEGLRLHVPEEFLPPEKKSVA